MSYAEVYTNVEAQQRSIVNQVYTWMAVGLLTTAVAATVTANTPALFNLVYGNSWTYLILIFAELGLVIGLSAAINKLSQAAATGLFLLYSALNGLTLSAVLLYYSSTSVGTAFVVTAGMFAGLSVFGFVTKTDLTRLGNIMIMLLFGLILASIANIFFSSSTLYWITTYAGVIIFTGLTAYDAQKIKRLSAQVGGTESAGKYAILGALTLYLDFVNLFLFLLRIFGRRN